MAIESPSPLLPPAQRSLNVIALISGGKDSLFSLLHCRAAGHQVVALANLYPAPTSSTTTSPPSPGTVLQVTQEADTDVRRVHNSKSANGVHHDESIRSPAQHDIVHDIDSFMYQTIGHQVVPLYEQVFELPLIRQPILGSAHDTKKVYSGPDNRCNAGSAVASSELDQREEVEDLYLLLSRVRQAFPTANAVCSGAILSDYQRTRVEHVARRLDLIPLSFLWQYPFLRGPLPKTHGPQPHHFGHRLEKYDPDGTDDAALLTDMAAACLDARIVKVSSGGLDTSFLGQSVTQDTRLRGRLKTVMARFSAGDPGALIGEGGEYETLVVDGPTSLWQRKLHFDLDQDAKATVDSGGAASLHIQRVGIAHRDRIPVDGPPETVLRPQVREPELFEPLFAKLLDDNKVSNDQHNEHRSLIASKANIQKGQLPAKLLLRKIHLSRSCFVMSNLHSTVPSATLEQQLEAIRDVIADAMRIDDFAMSDIVLSVLMLRSMADFSTVNNLYGTWFDRPEPAARITVASSSSLPRHADLTLTILVCRREPSPTLNSAGDGLTTSVDGLHVQSRSYWAPANIGPYSQAKRIVSRDAQGTLEGLVFLSGQIALVPTTMELVTGPFEKQCVLALQHLLRVARCLGVHSFISAIGFFTARDSNEASLRVDVLGRIWRTGHALLAAPAEDENDDGDELDEQLSTLQGGPPPAFFIQVSELPRGASAEWTALGSLADDEDLKNKILTPASSLPELISLSTGETLRAKAIYYPIFQQEEWDTYLLTHKTTLQSAITPQASEANQSEGKSRVTILFARESLLSSSSTSSSLAKDTMLFPCQSIWAPDGRDALAIVVSWHVERPT